MQSEQNIKTKTRMSNATFMTSIGVAMIVPMIFFMWVGNGLGSELNGGIVGLFVGIGLALRRRDNRRRMNGIKNLGV